MQGRTSQLDLREPFIQPPAQRHDLRAWRSIWLLLRLLRVSCNLISAFSSSSGTWMCLGIERNGLILLQSIRWDMIEAQKQKGPAVYDQAVAKDKVRYDWGTNTERSGCVWSAMSPVHRDLQKVLALTSCKRWQWCWEHCNVPARTHLDALPSKVLVQSWVSNL
jgi:hypothetical protein